MVLEKQLSAKRFLNTKWPNCKININYFLDPEYLWQCLYCTPQPCFWTQTMSIRNSACYHGNKAKEHCLGCVGSQPRLRVHLHIYCTFKVCLLEAGKMDPLARAPALQPWGPGLDPQHPGKKPVMAWGARNPRAGWSWSWEDLYNRFAGAWWSSVKAHWATGTMAGLIQENQLRALETVWRTLASKHVYGHAYLSTHL